MVTSAAIKQLRELSGAGMIDCKNALTEANGDIERATEILREKGLSALAKKSGKIATEGLSYARVENGKGIIVEVNSQTDFVAKNEMFINFVEGVIKQIANSSATTTEQLLQEPWILDKSITVEQELSGKTAIIGEKLNIRRFEKIESNNTIVNYIHAGGKVAVLVELAGNNSEKLIEAGKNVAMQIAAMNPQFLDRSAVSPEFIEKERKILTEQALAEGKPANIVEKMIEGRLSKNLKELCLLDQEYVKDSNFTIETYLKSVSKELGIEVSIKKFIRFETGEGMEKKEEDFAEEVKKAMEGN
ncbi:MAG: translation elongation factor Ts [Defluviitaleaceae bacterium]|nr:translation elongation factor Ts [Defluviitaleaceae bacterium]